jgi:hypothetical protein
VSDWTLPPAFEAIVCNHHSLRRADGVWSMDELIKVSCRLADAAGFPAFPGCEIAQFSLLRDELPAREQRTFHTELETLAGEVASRINAVESL